MTPCILLSRVDAAEKNSKLLIVMNEQVNFSDIFVLNVSSSCIGSALLSQNYWCQVTSTLYKPDSWDQPDSWDHSKIGGVNNYLLYVCDNG